MFYEPCTTTCYANSSFLSPSPSTFSPYSSFPIPPPHAYTVVTPINNMLHPFEHCSQDSVNHHNLIWNQHVCRLCMLGKISNKHAQTSMVKSHNSNPFHSCLYHGHTPESLKHAPMKKANSNPAIFSCCITESPLASFFTE